MHLVRNVATCISASTDNNMQMDFYFRIVDMSGRNYALGVYDGSR